MSEDLYRAVTGFARDAPAWVHAFAGTGTDAGLLVFGVLFVAAWWRGRSGDGRAVALALLAPVATAFGYAVSEALKSLVDEERPCRAVVGAVASIAPCPPYGDWSFPSNHSAVAGASATALALAWRRSAWLTAPLAVALASSRVFVGVHYPHDAAAGLVVGALAAVLFLRPLTGRAERLVGTVRTGRPGALRWLAGPGPAPSRPRRSPRSATAARPSSWRG
ncbi:phosphatase PAP2 family protein, partial [Streptomyces somaliensis DSM 40738]|uniref:phosphatase PAP2 family protein n=1 Tax=Streptomyces somaliensis TaxID=78355 RepID=UPI0021C3C8C3